MQDTALVIMMICDGDYVSFRQKVVEWERDGKDYHTFTVEDMKRAYRESGWEEENAKLGKGLECTECRGGVMERVMHWGVVSFECPYCREAGE